MLAADSSVQRPEDKASAMELSDLIAAELTGSWKMIQLLPLIYQLLLYCYCYTLQCCYCCIIAVLLDSPLICQLLLAISFPYPVSYFC